MLKELVRAFFLIFAAEMGDKTQIIAMTFATQYMVKEVLAGVALGVFFNHGLAIILGRYLSRLIDINSLQLIAGIMFVLFGVFALRDEDMDEEGESRNKYGPILTVALAFFLGELGDKTQLTAMSLATEANYPVFILMGTILGMLATSGLGIFVGSRMGDKIPDLYIKLASSLVFVFFGSLKLYQQLPSIYLKPVNIIVYLVLIGLVEFILMRKLIDSKKTAKTAMQKAAEKLYLQEELLSKAVDEICLGEESCGNCQGTDCIIGYTRSVLANANRDKKYYLDEEIDFSKIKDKDFSRRKVGKALSLILREYSEGEFIEDERFIVNRVKTYLEILLFDEKIEEKNIEDYLSQAKKIDGDIGLFLENEIKS